MQVLRAPDPKLRVRTKPVKKISPEILRVAGEMVKVASSFKDPEGMGLASIQIGRKERFFVGRIGKKFQIFLNPKIISSVKKKKVFFEGCLSIPNYYGEVKRPVAVVVEYLNETGGKITKNLQGVPAWIFQHEVDHLNGVLFMDHVLQQKGRIFKVMGKNKIGEDIFEEVTL